MKKDHRIFFVDSVYYPLLTRTPADSNKEKKGKRKKSGKNNKINNKKDKVDQYRVLQNIYILINHLCSLLPRDFVQACVLALAGLAYRRVFSRLQAGVRSVRAVAKIT